MSNRDALLARHRRARAQAQVSNTMRDLDVADYSNDLSRMEQRIRMAEARADAQTQLNTDDMGDEIDSRFDTTERNAQIDNELAALKARMGQGGETPRGGQ
jgi:phage shock protein A